MHLSLSKALTAAVKKARDVVKAAKDPDEKARANEHLHILLYFKVRIKPFCAEFSDGIEEIWVEDSRKLPAIYKATFQLNPGASLRNDFKETLSKALPELVWMDCSKTPKGYCRGKWRTVAIEIVSGRLLTPATPGSGSSHI